MSKENVKVVGEMSDVARRVAQLYMGTGGNNDKVTRWDETRGDGATIENSGGHCRDQSRLECAFDMAVADV